MPEYHIGDKRFGFLKPVTNPDLIEIRDEDISGASLQQLLTEFHRKIDGREYSWTKTRRGQFCAVLRASKSGLRGPIEGKDFMISMFPTAEQRLKTGGELNVGGNYYGPRESMYLGGELKDLDMTPVSGHPIVTPGSIGKVHDAPCIFEGRPSLFLYYPEYNPGFFRIHDHKLQRILKEHHTKAMPVIEDAAKESGFESIIAMGPDQIRAEEERLNEDVVRLSYIFPYRRNQYQQEDITLSLGKHVYRGRYWVKRLQA